MSSWVGDWERALIPSARLKEARGRGKYRTQCKLGRHPVMELDPALWVTDSTLAPLGLSCVPCLKVRAAELSRALDLEVPGPGPQVPAPRKRERTHGKPGTYSGGCRCAPCCAAASAAQALYRQRRRERQAAERTAVA